MGEQLTLYSFGWSWEGDAQVPFVRKLDASRTPNQIRILNGGRSWRNYNPYYDCFTVEEALDKLQLGIDNQRAQAQQSLDDAADKQRRLDAYLEQQR